jgi:predicted alpha/beta-fold hydrolase
MLKKSLFKPAWWLPHAHLQTLWPTLCRSRIKHAPLSRERIELSDGDFIDIDWTAGEANSPIVVLLHGLEGSADSPYLGGMLRAIEAQGWRGALLYFRGCSGEINRLPHSYHAGNTLDIAFFTQMLRTREPNTPLAAIGFSLGGNVLLKWLGETGAENPLVAAVAISVPFDLEKCVQRLNSGFSRIYQAHLLRHLQRKIHYKLGAYPDCLALLKEVQVKEVRSLRAFDQHITAKLNHFSGAEEYYAQSSSRAYLRTITVPTLLLQAEDDPFLYKEVLPASHELGEQVQLEVSEKGGHLGFITGSLPWRPQYWLEERVPLFLRGYWKVCSGSP